MHSGESSQTLGRCAIVAESHAICSNLDFWRFARAGGGGREEEEEEEGLLPANYCLRNVLQIPCV